METSVVIEEQSQIAQARRQALAVAASCNLSEELAGRLALIVTEAGTNVLKYAGGGEMFIRPFADHFSEGVEVLVLDRGPGMQDVSRSAQDGHSSGGTLGFGMGTIARMSTMSDIFSADGRGTLLFSRVARPCATDKYIGPAERLTVSGLSIAKPGQEACGDMWAERRSGGALWVIVVDGLGHGPQAAEASAVAIRTFHAASPDDSPQDVIRAAHVAMKGTRGAVMAIAAIRPALGVVDFAGVGNITAVLTGNGEVKRIGSSDGTVGYSLRIVRDQSLTWHPDSALMLTSDGLSTRWNLTGHPGLISRHPSVISGVLYRDFSRHNDDATVVVIKGI